MLITAGTCTVAGAGSGTITLGPYPPGTTISYLTIVPNTAPSQLIRMAATCSEIQLWQPDSTGKSPLCIPAMQIVPVHVPLWCVIQNSGGPSGRKLVLTFSTLGNSVDVSVWAAVRPGKG